MKRLTGLYVVAIIAIALPFLFPDNYYVTVVGVMAGIHAVLAISLNLLMGYAGQISLGHAAFFGLGAYVSGISTTQFGWNPWLAMLLGVVLTSAIAYLVARPILRLKGHYLALATLGLGIIANIVFVELAITGGPDGMGDIPPLSIFGWIVDTDMRWYIVIMTLLVVVLWLALNIIDSRSGRALRALHGSEVAAEMMGIDTTVTKTGVFVLAAGIASVVGSFFAHQQAFISPGSFNFFFSIELVTMVVLGGMASTYGAILGAVILTFLPELLVVFEDYEVMIFGGILMVMMIFLPQGLFIGFQELLQKVRSKPSTPDKQNPEQKESHHGAA